MILSRNRSGKRDGEVGDKKNHDPLSYLKKGDQSLCNRMKEACDDLRSTGKTIFGTHGLIS